ncbi:MAG: DUF2088 domain-containing protein [Phycisphaerae bacterium]|nr:DUF2088 domain-containing protein [Phycisphaerae bacterium]
MLVVIPDHTRTCPLPRISRALHTALAPRARRVDFLIALGTHPPLSEPRIDALLGCEPGRRADVFGESRIFNHAWQNPDALATLGALPSDEIERITGGRFAMDVEVTINRKVLEYDRVLICGPVFPHEVVGFSGGAKYFFPGICGEALLNFFHWLGAVISCPKIIGNLHTPVRALLHAALEMVPTPTAALTMVIDGADLVGLYVGDAVQAWEAAAQLSSRCNVTYLNHPFDSVLSAAPAMYDELWVGAKCMYKLEPVVADGGELIIYAPHITELSATHGAVIEQVGYHTRDYFLAQWDAFKDYPWGVLAHSTHVKGIGTYADGVERPRIQVTLATGIDEATCRRINLGYRDPASIDLDDWRDHRSAGRLYVSKAGETLYKLADPPAWQAPD